MAKTKNGRSKPPPSAADAVGRNIIFISKGTPEDDQFVLWLSPRLEAAGYRVFADILTLEPGDRWRKEITNTLRNSAAKMLLCCSDVTLDKTGVQEEISIAEDLAKELKDDRFIIPLRIQPYKKVFGIAGKQYVNFYQRWAAGLRDLLDTLDTQKVPRSGTATINPSWELYRKRLAVRVEEAPETLTTNWVPISSLPDALNYVEATGAVDHTLLQRVCEDCPFPAKYFLRGVLTFANASEIEKQLSAVGKFQQRLRAASLISSRVLVRPPRPFAGRSRPTGEDDTAASRSSRSRPIEHTTALVRTTGSFRVTITRCSSKTSVRAIFRGSYLYP